MAAKNGLVSHLFCLATAGALFAGSLMFAMPQQAQAAGSASGDGFATFSAADDAPASVPADGVVDGVAGGEGAASSVSLDASGEGANGTVATDASASVQLSAHTAQPLATPQAHPQNGWFYSDANQAWYYYSNGVMHRGWLALDDTWYYLDANGKMVTGVHTVPGDAAYFFNSSGKMQTGWTRDASTNRWYYAFSSGRLATGWYSDDAYWYYLDAQKYHMVVGLNTINGKTYLMDAHGATYQDKWVSQGNTWYFATESGALAQGWLDHNGYWFYLDPASFTLKTGEYFVNGSRYLADNNGALYTNKWAQSNRGWHYALASGRLTTGWMEKDGAWYYFDSTALGKTGLQKINDKWYYFDPASYKMAASSFVTWTDGSQQWADENGVIGAPITLKLTVDFRLINDDDTPATRGWQRIMDRWYYVKDGAGNVARGGWDKINGIWYHFQANGVMTTGWIDEGGARYYLKSSGAMATGWVMIDGQYHYFEKSGARVGTDDRFSVNAGHSVYVPGAIDMLNEAKEVHNAAYQLTDALKRRGKVAETAPNVGRTQVAYLREEYSHTSEVGASIAVSLHMNASTNRSAGGVEVLYRNADSKRLAARVSAALAAKLGLPDRGAKYRPDLSFLKNSSARQTILVELCFVTNSNDVQAWKSLGSAKAMENIAATITNTPELEVGWIKSGNRWWYRNTDGSYPAGRTQVIDGTAYRFDSEGWWIP